MFCFNFRFVFLFALPALAGACLFGQPGIGDGGSYPGHAFSGSFNTDNLRFIRIDIDHGATPQSADIDLEMICTSGPGFVLELYDWHEFIEGDLSARVNAFVANNNISSVNLTTPARAGVHPLLIKLSEIVTLGEVNEYLGGLQMTGATVVSQTDSDSLYNDPRNPWRYLHGDLGATFTAYTPGYGELSTNVRIDMGAGAQPATVRFDCLADGVTSMIASWPDGTGGRQQLVVSADASGNIPFNPAAPVRQFTIPAQPGVVEVTVSINTTAAFQYADWTIHAPGHAHVLSIKGPASGGGGGDDASCSTGGGNGPGPAIAAGVVLGALLIRRRARA